MGCDIHVHVEVYDTGFGEWAHYNEMDVRRDYELFGLLAGVRDTEFDCQIDPRGLPRDASEETKIAHADYHDSAHTESCIYGDEFRDMKGAKRRRKIGQFLRALEQMPGQPPERVRFVFWFDS